MYLLNNDIDLFDLNHALKLPQPRMAFRATFGKITDIAAIFCDESSALYGSEFFAKYITLILGENMANITVYF